MVAICSSKSLMLSRAVHGSFSVPISSSSEKFVRWVLSLLHRGRSWNFERPNEPSKSPLLTGQGWSLNIVVVLAQLLSLIRFFVTPWTAACQVSLSFTISWSLLKLMSSESVMPSNHLILCCPLLLLTSIFPSIRVFSNESVFESGGQSIGVSASASVLPMNIQTQGENYFQEPITCRQITSKL